MSKKKHANDVEEILENEDAVEDDSPLDEVEVLEEVEPLDPLEQKDQEIRALKEEALRVRAETDNFRKRLSKEKEDAVRYANEKLFKDLVPIHDNLTRALEAPNITVESLKEGVDLTSKQFVRFLEKHHVKPIEAIGEAFDPTIHEVLSQVESDEHEEGTIIDEFGKGYRMHDRVLIPSKVVTAKKPESSQTEEAPPSQETAS